MPTAGIQNSLRERGVRLTCQRRILLDLIAEQHKYEYSQCQALRAKEVAEASRAGALS